MGIKDTIANILKDPVKAVSDEVRKLLEQFKNMAGQKGGWYTAGYVVGTVTIALALAYVGGKAAQALTEALKGTKIGQAMAKTAGQVKGKVKEAVKKTSAGSKALVVVGNFQKRIDVVRSKMPNNDFKKGGIWLLLMLISKVYPKNLWRTVK